MSPLSSWATSGLSVVPSSFTGPKKSPMHSTTSNFPCFVLIPSIFANISRIEPTAEPTVRLGTQIGSKDLGRGWYQADSHLYRSHVWGGHGMEDFVASPGRIPVGCNLRPSASANPLLSMAAERGGGRKERSGNDRFVVRFVMKLQRYTNRCKKKSYRITNSFVVIRMIRAPAPSDPRSCPLEFP